MAVAANKVAQMSLSLAKSFSSSWGEGSGSCPNSHPSYMCPEYIQRDVMYNPCGLGLLQGFLPWSRPSRPPCAGGILIRVLIHLKWLLSTWRSCGSGPSSSVVAPNWTWTPECPEFCNSTLWSRCWTTATDSFESERAAVLWLLNENEPVFCIFCKIDKKNFFAFSQVSQLLWSVRCRRQIRAHNTISGLHSWKHRERIKKNKEMQSVPALFSGHLCELWKMTNYDWNNV